jgi:hypothetical protein
MLERRSTYLKICSNSSNEGFQRFSTLSTGLNTDKIEGTRGQLLENKCFSLVATVQELKLKIRNEELLDIDVLELNENRMPAIYTRQRS